MLVATIKGSLVVGFFMHLKYEDRFYAFVFMVTFLFVGIFFTFVLFDMSTTDDLNEEAGIEYKRHIEDSAEAAENAAAMKAAGDSGAHACRTSLGAACSPPRRPLLGGVFNCSRVSLGPVFVRAVLRLFCVVQASPRGRCASTRTCARAPRER